jgi:hypothetical protein
VPQPCQIGRGVTGNRGAQGYGRRTPSKTGNGQVRRVTANLTPKAVVGGRRYAYSKVGAAATNMLLIEPVSAAALVGSMLDSSATVVAQHSPQVAAQSPARSLSGSRSSGLPVIP